MAELTVNIKLDTSRYVAPTQEDIAEAKDYAKKRNEKTLALVAALQKLFRDATKKITRLGYDSKLTPENFAFGDDEDLREQVAEIMDELETDIINLIQEAALSSPLMDKAWLFALTQYFLSLGHKNKSFTETIHAYLWRYMHNIEAYIAACRLSDIPLKEAMAKIGGSVGQKGEPTLQQEMKTAYINAQNMSALFLQSYGEVFDQDGTRNVAGVPKDGMMAIENVARISTAMLWGQVQFNWMRANGAVGYYQLRGSSYPCAVCDDETGFHLGGINDVPLPHPNCMCYRIPIYRITE